MQSTARVCVWPDAEQMLAVLPLARQHLPEESCFNSPTVTGVTITFENGFWWPVIQVLAKRCLSENIFLYRPLLSFSRARAPHLFLLASPRLPALSLSLGLFTFTAFGLAPPSPSSLASFSRAISHVECYLCTAQAMSQLTQKIQQN